MIYRETRPRKVGVKVISATLNREVETLAGYVEPYLLQQAFISRTKTGCKANEPAYKHLSLPLPVARAGTLFD